MPLQAGQRLGHYEILALIGSGGMGEVYRALDQRLGRSVALKVLPVEAAGDEGRRARFEREARAVAALRHPGIVTVHSIEEAGGVLFLTMELVDGKSLEDLLSRTGLPIDKLLKIAIPLADAVSAAHEHGITHRDLKPANIMVDAGGRVRILDFGLAKLRDGSPLGDRDTETNRSLTGEGRIVGTVSYMSPEQAEGGPIDHRSDLFSLGVVFYRLSTGERPFTGDSVVSVLSSILKDTPKPVTDLNPRLPREFGRIVRRCLAKDPEHRYQTAKDLRNDLEELARDVASGEASAMTPVRRASPLTWGMWGAGLFVLAALLVSAMWWLYARRQSGGAPPAAVSAAFTRVTSQAGMEVQPSLSPDGKWVVYSAPGPAGNADIFLQSVGGQNPIDLTKDSPADDSEPAFSPDGEQIAFRSERQGGGLFVMGRTGEFPRRVSDAGFNPTWSPDGQTIAYSTVAADFNPYQRSGVGALWTVRIATGEQRLIYPGDAVQPAWSPHGQRLAFWTTQGGAWQRDVWTVSATGGAPLPVTNDLATDASPAWSADGTHLYFISDRSGRLSLWRVPIDEDSGRTSGPPEPLTAPSEWVADLAVSADGRHIAYASVTANANVQKFGLDAMAGRLTDNGTWITTGSMSWFDIDVSPDDRRLALRVAPVQEDLFVMGADGTGMARLTDDPDRDRWPKWSPDGRQIAFYSNRSGKFLIWIMNADGTGLHRPIDEMENLIYPSWEPSGALRMAGSNVRDYSVWLFDPRKAPGAQHPERLPPAPVPHFIETAWSPDGRRIAGYDDTTGLVVYDLSARTYDVVTDDRGTFPVWLGADRLLYVLANDVDLLDLRTKERHRLLSTSPDRLWHLAVSHDGRSLYLTRGAREADVWVATLK